MSMHARKIQGIGWPSEAYYKESKYCFAMEKRCIYIENAFFFHDFNQKSDEMFCIMANLCNFAGDFFEKRNHLII